MSSDPIGGYVEAKEPEGYAMKHPEHGVYFYHGKRRNAASAKEWLRQFVGRAVDDQGWVEMAVYLMGIESHE
jgi:hypothetical protein